jgi:hypothetical protein
MPDPTDLHLTCDDNPWHALQKVAEVRAAGMFHGCPACAQTAQQLAIAIATLVGKRCPDGYTTHPITFGVDTPIEDVSAELLQTERALQANPAMLEALAYIGGLYASGYLWRGSSPGECFQDYLCGWLQGVVRHTRPGEERDHMLTFGFSELLAALHGTITAYAPALLPEIGARTQTIVGEWIDVSVARKAAADGEAKAQAARMQS